MSPDHAKFSSIKSARFMWLSWDFTRGCGRERMLRLRMLRAEGLVFLTEAEYFWRAGAADGIRVLRGTSSHPTESAWIHLGKFTLPKSSCPPAGTVAWYPPTATLCKNSCGGPNHESLAVPRLQRHAARGRSRPRLRSGTGFGGTPVRATERHGSTAGPRDTNPGVRSNQAAIRDRGADSTLWT